jgi:hypothetical protein
LSLQILFEGQTLNDSVLAITSSTTVLLVITDIWCPILFFVVYDLLNLYKKEVEVRHSQNSPSLSLTCLSVSLSSPKYYEKNNGTVESDDRLERSPLIVDPFLD